MEKLKYEKLEVIQPRIKLKSELVVGEKPSRISPHEVLQSWLISNTVYHVLVNNNKGEGRGLKERVA